MLDKVIKFSFYLLFFLTPLIWTPLNFELFEYNKMMFVYLLTGIITTFWILKMCNKKTLLIKKTPLDIPLLLFLGSQILSTIFSIDPHTSLFGYYSRSNGGLLSIISYILLYYALVSNFDKQSLRSDDLKTQATKFLKASLLGGLFVALWAIPEHFGVSPSCVILRGDLSADCWVQDVTARVFATLGQPNWLAAYLGMLIFPAIYFALTIKKLKYYLLSIIYYLAFTFTYSRGATLGLIIGLAVFLSFWLVQNRFWSRRKAPPQNDIKLPLLVLGSFLLINLLYGSAITRFQLTKLAVPTQSAPNPAISQPTGLTQLENEGTESGQIRLIVWQGALEIFKHYPIFGSGVETFAYSYYQFRPVAHNLVSEWDFLYNKAHNEFLNYLATTGIVGFISYIAIILVFIIWSLRQKNLFVLAILASIIFYHIQNFFGFSVVAIALFFYLFPALAFIQTDATTPLKLSKISLLKPALFIIQIITTSALLILILNLSLMWKADTFFAKGEKDSDNGHPGLAYQELAQATFLNGNEPYYESELGYVAAQASLVLKDTQESTLSASLLDEAIDQTNQALHSSPKNVSLWRTAIRTYYVISAIKPEYVQKTLDTIDHTITLAPSDPKLLYNKAIILGTIDKNSEAIQTLQKAINLKPNYRDAYYALGLFYFDQKKTTEAVETMNKVLKLIPNDPEALSQLVTWGKQGIATKAAEQK